MKKDGVLKMVTVEQMRKILIEEYGIKDDKELGKAIKNQGGIKIDLFTEKSEFEQEQGKMLA